MDSLSRNESGHVEWSSEAKLAPGDHEWSDVATALISAARIIVFYFSDWSAGVKAELELIRGASRQAATVLI